MQNNPEQPKTTKTDSEQAQTIKPKRSHLPPATQNPRKAHLKPPAQPNCNNFKQVDKHNRLVTKKKIKQEDPKTLQDKSKLPQ